MIVQRKPKTAKNHHQSSINASSLAEMPPKNEAHILDSSRGDILAEFRKTFYGFRHVVSSRARAFNMRVRAMHSDCI